MTLDDLRPVRCPKCGYKGGTDPPELPFAGPEYHGYMHYDFSLVYVRADWRERLWWTCNRCGYRIETATLDTAKAVPS